MKKITLVILVGLLALLCACGQPATAQTPPPEEPASSVPAPTLPEPEGSAPVELGVPMDAALYRGTITAVEEEGGDIVLTLEQAPGTNFGAPVLRVRLEERTRMILSPSEFAVGNYVEAYYGAMGGVPEEAAAIQIARLPEADLCLFNGSVAALTVGDDPERKSLLLTSLEGKGDIVFHYDDSTRIYLDLETLAVGDQLNVYFNGVTTRSMPPQATAMEIRPYYQEEAQNPVTAGSPSVALNGSVPLVAPGEQTPEGLSGVAVKALYAVDTETIEVKLYNRSGAEAALGLGYTIERQTENGWETLPLSFAVIEIALLVPPGGEVVQTFSLHRDQNDYTPGAYRLMWRHTTDIPIPFVLGGV